MIKSLLGESTDPELEKQASESLKGLRMSLEKLEFQQKMSGEHDVRNAFLEINAGGGGTDAQDWAEMLYRMYIRWAEASSFEIEEVDYQPGEGAGIKSAILSVKGRFAYGWLRSERGVHRLVRISPFNANGKRQTSFASVAATPELEEGAAVKIAPEELRVDTYRSSGAGGQHVNKTDSAVRLTHLPTGLVVACQSERSQHKNKDRAMSILLGKLVELEQKKRKAELDEVKGDLQKIDFGSQIRSYVLHPYKMVKDLRTNWETSSVEKVLDGELRGVMESYLLSDFNQG